MNIIYILLLLGAASCITLPSTRNKDEDCTMYSTGGHDDWVPRGLYTNTTQQTLADIHNKYSSFLVEQAAALQCNVNDLAAVLYVESGGSGFSTTNDGKMTIRFENHIFYKYYTNNGANAGRVTIFNDHFQYNTSVTWQGHYWRASTSDAWTYVHSSQATEWACLQYAQSLDDTNALYSISMGSAQIMGFNHASIGYNNVQTMFLEFSRSLKSQFLGFIGFIKSHSNCLTGLKTANYDMFAGCYNGAGNVAIYSPKISSASVAYADVAIHPLCTSSGRSGVCRSSNCVGDYINGVCPGGSSYGCCLGDVTDYGTCKLVTGEAGVCMSKEKCYGYTTSGLCPGSSSILCCVKDPCSVDNKHTDSSASSIIASVFVMMAALLL